MDKTLSTSSQMEQALQESQDRLMGIISSAMDAIITISEDQHILLFNNAAENMFGYRAGEVLGRPLDVLLPERSRAAHRRHVSHFGRTGVTNREMRRLGRLYGRRANGEEFPIEASISQVQTATGKLFTVILRDISLRIADEARLIDSEQQLRATFEQAAVGIAHVSPDGRYLRVNQRLCQIMARTEEEILSLAYPDITYAEDLPANRELFRQLLAGEITRYTLEKRMLKPDGDLIWVVQTVSLVRDLEGKPKYAIKVIEDITARKSAEAALQRRNDELKSMSQQLWQSAKLATMGELAASIAHELNNPLAILSLRVESLMGSFPEGSPEARELQIMEQETERMASLVSNLLQFSRSTQHQVSSLDVREEIDKTLELVHTHFLHRHIEVECRFQDDVPMLLADRQQLRQLFLNLFTNASDAMPDGGRLAIQVEHLPESQNVEIKVRDTGIGIAPQELRRVSEPFYTTKPDGKGTGLGLSICRRIVEEHHGTLKISSPGEGKGTTVEILLPGHQENRARVIFEE